jgi:hypothetical protein
MEHVVNCRLVWVLEGRNFLCSAQSGFCPYRFTFDHLANLEHKIRNSFLLCQLLVVIWHYWMILQLKNHLPVEFEGFVSLNTF